MQKKDDKVGNKVKDKRKMKRARKKDRNSFAQKKKKEIKNCFTCMREKQQAA